MSRPLESLKIIEMAGLGPCPLAGQLLADLGAELIVVDRHSGQDISKDINRRGKQSIALNLKTSKGLETVKKLIGNYDILIEGFRPGVMERLGLGPEECLRINPQLIYARMTGWGQEGPLSRSAGHDINYLAITGALHAMGNRHEPPLPPLNLVADYGGGSMFLIMGVLAAVIERNITRTGRVVDAAMVDGVPAMMGLIHTMVAQGSWTRQRQDNFVDGGAPWYRCYKCLDGKFISVGAIEPQFFAELLRLLSLDPKLSEKQNHKASWPALHALFEETFYTKTRDEWAGLFEGRDACVSPVLDFNEAKTYPHNVQRKAFLHTDSIMQANMAPRFSGPYPRAPEMANTTGLDGRKILTSAGFSDATITELENSGVLL